MSTASTDLTRQAMQFFCEPFFHAIDRWMKYDDEELFKNRIKLIATSVKILSEDLHEQNSYDVVVENETAELLPAVVPTAGSVYVSGGDQIAFNEVKKLVSADIFQAGGLYFQNFLLRALSGGSPKLIATQNVNTRMSAIRAVEIVFRLSKSAGMASYIARGPDHDSEAKDYQLVELSGEALTLFETLKALSPELNPEGFRAVSPSPPPAAVAEPGFSTPGSNGNHFLDNKEKEMHALGLRVRGKEKSNGPSVSASAATGKAKAQSSDKKSKKNKQQSSTSSGTAAAASAKPPAQKKKKIIREEEDSEEEPEAEDDGDDENIDWKTDHPKVGARVAAYFDVDEDEAVNGSSGKKNKRRKLKKVFGGTVTKYAPESGPGENDELYHVQWDDGDEQDYDINELQQGEKLFAGSIVSAPPAK